MELLIGIGSVLVLYIATLITKRIIERDWGGPTPIIAWVGYAAIGLGATSCLGLFGLILVALIATYPYVCAGVITGITLLLSIHLIRKLIKSRLGKHYCECTDCIQIHTNNSNQIECRTYTETDFEKYKLEGWKI